MKANLPTMQKLCGTVGMILVGVLAVFGKGTQSLVTAAVFCAVIVTASYCAEAESAEEKQDISTDRKI
jgi:CHASE3 domain sensor protein